MKKATLVVVFLAATLMAVMGCNSSRPAPIAAEQPQLPVQNEDSLLKVQVAQLKEQVATLYEWWGRDLDHNLCSLQVCITQLVEQVRVDRELGDHEAYGAAERLSNALEAYRLSDRQMPPRDVPILQGGIDTLLSLVQNQLQERKLAAERTEGERPAEDDQLLTGLLDWLKKVKVGEPPAALPPRPGS